MIEVTATKTFTLAPGDTIAGWEGDYGWILTIIACDLRTVKYTLQLEFQREPSAVREDPFAAFVGAYYAEAPGETTFKVV